MKKNLRDIVGIAGMALVSVGAGMIYFPAGVVIAGLLLVVVALFGFTPDKPQKKAGD
jgi:amino acid permease